ncbi:TadE/TadG family type IV pilus assembly protein [Halovulum sp. GXIMD14794]
MISELFAEARKVFRQRLSELKQDEDGGTNTIEFVLWLPIFILILSIVVDVCFMFLAQAVMYDVASDTARRLAVSSGSQADIIADAKRNATFGGVEPAVVPTMNLDGTGVIRVVVTHKVQDVDVVGVFGSVASTFASDEINATVYQVKEREGVSASN